MSRHVGQAADLQRGTAAQCERFIATVAQQAGLSWDAAERAVSATLATLAERLSPGEARDVAEQLPVELRGWLTTDRPAEPFHVDEFVRRVAMREGRRDLAEVERHVRAVFHALVHEIGRDELEDVRAELPKDFEPLLAGIEPPPPPQRMPVEEFLVAEREGVTRDQAREHARAVLATLREAVPEDELRDVVAQLPDEYAAILAPA